MSSKIYIGPAGWIYNDWEGIVYPVQREKKFDPLVYIAQFVNLVEINSSFYRPPVVKTALKWVERIKSQPEFLFTYKLWQVYTHNRGAFPGEGEEVAVKSGLDVLKTHNRLGALLIQFPWSFKKTSENQDWLVRVITTFADYNPVVEVRHNSWNGKEFLCLLNDTGAAFANIDQPTIGQSIGLTAFSSERLSYLRLHGRNFKNWFSKEADVASRYDYLYRDDELSRIAATIEHMIDNSPKTFIVFNNHFRGQAVANALQMMHLLEGKRINVPVQLTEIYPQLKLISLHPDSTVGQVSLFND